LAGIFRDRREGVVIDLAAGHDRDALVQQTGELPENATLGLAAETKQDEMVPRQQGVDDLGKDGVVVPDDTGEQGIPAFQPAEQVAPDFIANGPSAQRWLRPAAVLQFT